MKLSTKSWVKPKGKVVIVSAGVAASLLCAGILVYMLSKPKAALTQDQLKLVGSSSINQELVTLKDGYYTYNHQSDKNTNASVVLSTTKDATGKIPYVASLPVDTSKPIKFGSAQDSREFSIKPKGITKKASYNDGRVVYSVNSSQKRVYTFKRNGIKEDILLSKSPGDTATYNWDLDLGSELEARVLSDGSIGIYSAADVLYNNLTVADDKSKNLVDNAKKSGEKQTLVFVLPKPFIIEKDGKKNYTDVSYELKGSELILHAKNLNAKSYPLSIDPTAVITTTADFTAGTNSGLVDYGVADQIERGDIAIGDLNTFDASTAYFTQARDATASIAYNGFLYVTGGQITTSSTNCKNTGVAAVECNDVQYAAINSNGTLGSFATTTYFTFPRMGHAVAAYGGYLYIIGGRQIITNSDTNCKNTGVASNRCNDIQYALVCTGSNNGVGGCGATPGTLGTFANTSYFSFPRYFHSATVYGGYMYITGGEEPTASTGGCKNTGISDTQCNDTQYAVINATGTVGSFTTSSYFATPRRALSAAAYNGFLYVAGGVSNTSSTACKNSGTSTLCNDVQYAPLNADGSVGTFANTSYFSLPRRGHGIEVSNGTFYIYGGTDGTIRSDVQYAAINSDGTLATFTTSTNATLPTERTQFGYATYGGFLYLVGGTQTASNTSCKNAGTDTKCNDVRFVQINTATVTGFGALSSWTIDAGGNFTTARNSHATVAYNGYLYVIGGNNGAGLSDVQYAPLNLDGSVGTWAATSSFTNARQAHTVVVYDNYMYVIGGLLGAASTNCKDAGSSTECNDVQFAAIDSTNGTLGAWGTTSYFLNARHNHTSVAYGGYLYILGGSNTVNLNDVQYALVCTGSNAGVGGCGSTPGTVGSWHYTHNSVDDGITVGGGFSVARNNLSSAVYNGRVYLMGGFAGGTYYATVEYATLNTDGTVGSWASTTSFSVARANHSSAVYAGYLYVFGGQHATSDTLCNGTASNYCSDVQYAKINSDGTVGTWSTTNSYSSARFELAGTMYNGYIYLNGGFNGAYQNDTQYAGVKTPENKAAYERIIDLGSVNTLSFLTVNGSTDRCANISIKYRTAGSGGTFGSAVTLPSIIPGRAYPINQGSIQFMEILMSMDDATCGGQTYVTDITLSFNTVPSPPTLFEPANNATGVSVTPRFVLGTTDSPGDYVRYKIEVCSVSNCASIVRTIDQTASQTGWLSQNTQSGTAYTTSASAIVQEALHDYQPAALSPSTQYWWRAYAIDPGGDNTFSTASSIFTFTTGATAPSNVNIKGGTTIRGGTTLN